jgi:dihydroorotate dehydrogenase (NAD+) catalytic subunit
MHEVLVGGVTLQNPILNAAGTMGFGSSYADYIDLNRLGGLVTRTMTAAPRPGASNPRLWETVAGLLNHVGLQNPGYEKFAQIFYRSLEKLHVPVVASITGTPDEIRQMTGRLCELERVKAIEVNLYCTYEQYRTMGYAAYLESCCRQVEAAAQAGDRPVWVKLLPLAGDIVETVRAAAAAGAKCAVCANTYWAMALDETGHSRLGSQVGGLSGPAIKPLSVFQTWRLAQETELDIVGCGGVMTADDVKEYLVAGAKAVCVGTANFNEPSSVEHILNAL